MSWLNKKATVRIRLDVIVPANVSDDIYVNTKGVLYSAGLKVSEECRTVLTWEPVRPWWRWFLAQVTFTWTRLKLNEPVHKEYAEDKAFGNH